VSTAASATEIRAAYRDLVARYHPDRHDGNALADLATEKLASLNAAYGVLSDPQRRALYDSELAQEFRPSAPGRSPAAVTQRRMLRAIALTGGLVLLVRLFPLAVRTLVALAEALWEGAGLLRGAPLYAALFFTVVGGSTLFIVRRGKASGRK
jgi:curved DNA-binding protein CbpA